MSASYDRLIEAAIESLRTHVLPATASDFARGQLFSVIFALDSLKLAGDWKLSPLAAQIAIQDAAFAKVLQLGAAGCPTPPKLPRGPEGDIAVETLENLRNDGDRLIGEMLAWTSGAGTHHDSAPAIARVLREAVKDQLKVELAITPKSMLHSIATGEK